MIIDNTQGLTTLSVVDKDNLLVKASISVL